MKIIQIIYIYFLIINSISFTLYGIDKYKAKNGKYRISEFTLLLTTVLGGFLGTSLSMILFKHKLSKKYFIITTTVITVIYLILLGIYLF